MCEQVLTPELFTTRIPIRSFGWSVSGGADLDGNQYPDVVVGAYETEQAFVIRTRPVMHVTSTLTSVILRYNSLSSTLFLEIYP